LINDSVPSTNTFHESGKFPYKSFIVPTIAIAYGFVSLNSDALKDVGEHFKKALSSEPPHGPIHLDNYLQFAPAAAVYGLNIAGIKGKNNFIDRTMIYLMSTAIMASSVYAVKNWTHQLRPDSSDYYSFPSGHTAEAFLSAEFLFQEYKNVSIWYGISGYVVAASVGFLRMYNNKHWFQDVVAGAGFGVVSTKLSYWLYPKIKKWISGSKPLHSMVLPSYNQNYWSVSFVHLF